MFLRRYLGMAPEEGRICQDKMSDPAYKPPPTSQCSTSAKVAKWGAYMHIYHHFVLEITQPAWEWGYGVVWRDTLTFTEEPL